MLGVPAKAYEGTKNPTFYHTYEIGSGFYSSHSLLWVFLP